MKSQQLLDLKKDRFEKAAGINTTGFGTRLDKQDRTWNSSWRKRLWN